MQLLNNTIAVWTVHIKTGRTMHQGYSYK